VKGYHGHLHWANKTDVTFANIDCDKTIAVTFQHDENIPEGKTVVIQAAMLFTTADGQRRIRVHSLALAATNNLTNLFKSVDVYCLINLLGRNGACLSSALTVC
jgi:protein transport protein SEC24